MKAPGTMLMKQMYDVPLSNFAFNFNLRRYVENVTRSCKPPEEISPLEVGPAYTCRP